MLAFLSFSFFSNSKQIVHRVPLEAEKQLETWSLLSIYLLSK